MNREERARAYAERQKRAAAKDAEKAKTGSHANNTSYQPEDYEAAPVRGEGKVKSDNRSLRQKSEKKENPEKTVRKTRAEEANLQDADRPLTRKEKEALRVAERQRVIRRQMIIIGLAAILLIAVIAAAVSIRSAAQKGNTTVPTAEESLEEQTGRIETELSTDQVDETENEQGTEQQTEEAVQPAESTPAETVPPTTMEVNETGDNGSRADINSEDYKQWQEAMRDIQSRMPVWVTQDFLSINEFSRPSIFLDAVNNIVIHYVGNPGTTAQSNRNYFENLANPEVNPQGHKASSNFVVGLEGEIIQCMPIFEVAYASNNRNSDTISIEVCHPGEDGKFSDVTYDSLIRLCTFLCHELNLTADDLIRHYDVTTKMCPKYYVENPDAWEQLKQDVNASIAATYGN